MQMKRIIFVAAIPVLLSVMFVAIIGSSSTGQMDTGKSSLSPRDSMRAELESKVAAIFAKSCSTSGCHEGGRPKMNLSLEADKLEDPALKDFSRQVDTLKIVDPGRPDKSYLIMKIKGLKAIKGRRMPIAKPALSLDEEKIIELWIENIETGKSDTLGK